MLFGSMDTENEATPRAAGVSETTMQKAHERMKCRFTIFNTLYLPSDLA